MGIYLEAIEEHQNVISQLRLAIPESNFKKVANAILEAFRDHHKLLFCGNGGSAADAQHLSAEFTGRFKRERKALPAMALHCNTSSLTAIANDYSYENVFAREVEAFGEVDDILICLSTSGNSKNIINAIMQAKKQQLLVLGLTGASGGAMKELCNWCFCVPSTSTARIQEAHILLGHCLCEFVDSKLSS